MHTNLYLPRSRYFPLEKEDLAAIDGTLMHRYLFCKLDKLAYCYFDYLMEIECLWRILTYFQFNGYLLLYY